MSAWASLAPPTSNLYITCCSDCTIHPNQWIHLSQNEVKVLKIKLCPRLKLRVRNKKLFYYFSTKTYVVGTQKNLLTRWFFWAPKTYVKDDGKENIFIGILQVLRFDFQKFRILEILNFHPGKYEIAQWKSRGTLNTFNHELITHFRK